LSINHSRINELKNQNRTVAQIHDDADNYEKGKALVQTVDVHMESFHLEEMGV